MSTVNAIPRSLGKEKLAGTQCRRSPAYGVSPFAGSIIRAWRTILECRPARVRSPPILDGRPNPRAVQTPWQCGGANELDGTSAVNATRSRAVSWLQKRATASAHCSRKSTYNSTQSYSPLNRAQGQADACHYGVPGSLLLLRIQKIETVNRTAAPFRKVATAV